MSNKPIISLYYFSLHEGKEKQFQKAWSDVANYCRSHGAIDARLALTDENIWVAISEWPSLEVHEKVWPPHESQAQPFQLYTAFKDCVESFNKASMQLIDQV